MGAVEGKPCEWFVVVQMLIREYRHAKVKTPPNWCSSILLIPHQHIPASTEHIPFTLSPPSPLPKIHHPWSFSYTQSHAK